MIAVAGCLGASAGQSNWDGNLAYAAGYHGAVLADAAGYHEAQ